MMPMGPKQAAMSRMGAMGVAPDETTRMDAGKTPMGDAGYRQAETPEMSCQTCAHFQAPDACELVAGRIDPNGVSDLFEPLEAPPTAV